jgi:replication fork protection complex subunit Csm3/Swi3
MAADPPTSVTVDDLLNFDSTDDEDPFKDKPSRPTNRGDETSKRKASDFDDMLGLDAEVKIKKQRKPIAKLDEARLLSAPGIPKLRADARMPNFLTKKLKIKGKGHEFSDVARLLNYYQLWLDDLYPRAKFADGLQLVEKAGHSRRMQTMRREWIDEGKPWYLREKEAKKKVDKEERDRDREQEAEGKHAGEEGLMSGANNEPLTTAMGEEDDSLFIPESRTKGDAEKEDVALPDDDELDALLAQQETRATSRPSTAPKRIVEDDSEGEDDLDALLAEQETRQKAPAASAPLPKPQNLPFGEDDDEDMDDLDALLAEQESRSKSTTVRKQPDNRPSTAQSKVSPTPADEEEFPIDETDDLDALLAEQEARASPAEQVAIASTTAAELSAPALRAMDEEVAEVPAETEAEAEADGADMFPSSPVQDTASSRLLPSGRRELDSPEEETVNIQAIDEGDVQATKAAKEDSQGLDADDMFSSSPVQNELIE